MRTKLFNSGSTMKSAKLRKSNWKKVAVSDKVCVYQHNKRKHVILSLDTNTNVGFFKDKRTNKIISEYKKINWL